MVEIVILGNTNQSDDSILYVIGFDSGDLAKEAESYGLTISKNSSSDLLRDGFVVFLQMYMGWARKIHSDIPDVWGNVSSRYLKFAHSEREIDKEHPKSGSLDGVYNVTGDADLDAAISKLASFGKHLGKQFVLIFLYLVKDTVFGKKILRAISSIDPTKQYELYRSDVVFGMNPAWLGTIQVQDLLVDDWLKKMTDTVK